jgi:hypothetical protein
MRRIHLPRSRPRAANSVDPKAEEYRRQAEECRLQAERSEGDEDKARWLKIAAQWQVLAESVHNDLVAILSRKPEPANSRTRLIGNVHFPSVAA